MTRPIEPIRRSAPVRRTKRGEAEGASAPEPARNLPVPMTQAPAPAPPRPAAPLAAQLLGEGERRGLRGGEPVLKAAKSAYVRTEWSGPADRRAPKGKLTKKEI